MNTSPMAYGVPNLNRDPRRRHDLPDIRTDHTVAKRDVGNVLNGYDDTMNVGVNEEFLQIQAWLSPLEPNKRHQDVRNRRLDGVGDWVLRREEFESWRTSQDGSEYSTLLCYGGQGVGKTYISSLVIDGLCEKARGRNVAVLFLYCDYQAQKHQLAVNMLGSLLSQVAVGATRIPGDIKSAFDESNKRGGQGLRFPDMLKLFVKVVSSIERAYICVDAVDELLPQDRSEFLRALRQITQDAPNTRLFITGRPYIRGELDKHLIEGAHIVHIVADQEDIARYISQKMDEDDDRDPDLMTENLKNDIMKTVLEKASEMFLLVALNIDAILGETSLARRKRMLQKVATTGVNLESVYSQTLQRIREQKGDRSRLGMAVFMWVSHSERPLRIDELCHALAVEIGSTDLDPENIRPQDTVLRSCLGLAVVDQETSVVRLIHYTLQEYLSRPGILPDAHKTLAETCLTYLNHERVKGLPTDSSPNLREMPFLEYSSICWGGHVKVELSDPAKFLALQLLNRYDNHISAALLFNQINSYGSSLTTDSLFTGLHCASYFGIVEVVAALIEMKGRDINQRDCMGFTPLMWAAQWGNGGVVRLLLTRGDANPEQPDNCGQTPLCCASRNGHEGVVKLLLTRGDVNPGRPDNDGRTPLWHASRNGHEEVVRLLLTCRNVNPDQPDNSGQTPLGCAAGNGHEGVVGLLLAREDVNPGGRAYRGQTPLWCASWNGHEGVVRLLLARGDVNPDEPDNYGQTPLLWASGNGHEGVARLLLTCDDISPDQPDKYGQTPLWWASSNGREGVVRLLLTRVDVNPDRPNNKGRTPFWQASRNGYEGVVRLLLSRGDVNPNKPDNYGRTPLGCASAVGHEGVVRLLLTRKDIDPDTLDIYGQTPLRIASVHGHREIADLLQPRTTAF